MRVEDRDNIKSRPSSAHQRNAIQIVFRWPNIECRLGSFVIFHGIQTSIDNQPYSFVIFQGGRGSRPPVPLWICAWWVTRTNNKDMQPVCIVAEQLLALSNVIFQMGLNTYKTDCFNRKTNAQNSLHICTA